MAGKAKPKKHTAKEIASKVDAATTNRGGGKAGMADRTGQEKGGHAKLECPHCKITVPDVKSMQIHHDARHPKIPFDEAKLNNLHATHVEEPSKARPGVRVDDMSMNLSKLSLSISKGLQGDWGVYGA